MGVKLGEVCYNRERRRGIDMKGSGAADRSGRQEGLWEGGLVGLILLGALVGGLLGESRGPGWEQGEEPEVPLIADFERLARAVDSSYATLPDWDRLGRGAIRGMLSSLDPHSNFFDRREFSEMQNEQNSKFYGIGVTVNQRNQRMYVIGVERGLSADRAGIRYGDAILAVDGQTTELWTQANLLTRVRGERGTVLEMTVDRAGSGGPLTFRLERDEVPYPSVRNAFLLRDGIGYVGLTGGFNLETTRELHATIERLKMEGMEGLVLDLRRNPGGLLKQAVQVAETFLRQGTEIVAVRGREGRRVPQIYRSENPAPEEFPLVLLIDRETASASEIVAGALQDHRRAWIIGEESFGKGLVQNVFRLRGGTGLTLTTARYYTPAGRLIQRSEDRAPFRRERLPFPDPTPDPGVVALRSLPPSLMIGGIQPDWVVPREQERLALRDLCFEFARLLTSGGFPELAAYRVKRSELEHRFQGNEFLLTDRVLWQFRQFVQKSPHLPLSLAEIDAQQSYVRRRIRAEVIAAAYGMEVAEQYLIESDAPAQQAVRWLEKARRDSPWGPGRGMGQGGGDPRPRRVPARPRGEAGRSGKGSPGPT
jgi:carboxyl-terminal processing protease